MSTKYDPDGWTIIKLVEAGKLQYKLFATWRWEDDKWRVSSGVENLKALSKSGDKYIWPQSSGSIYHLPVNGENGFTAYQGAVLENIKARYIQEGIEFDVVPLRDLVDLTDAQV